MVVNVISKMQQAQAAITYFGGNKRKERFDIILDPLQAVIQLACLRFCPIGTKLSIENNLLLIQLPSFLQGLTRSWNKDKREDVLLLFNAIQRFNKIYVAKARKAEAKQDKVGCSFLSSLIKTITYSALLGLDNLINTYSRVDNVSIVQALSMYKNILSYPEKFSGISEVAEGEVSQAMGGGGAGGLGSGGKKKRDKDKDKERKGDEGIDNYDRASAQDSPLAGAGADMETVFAQIRKLWSEDEMAIVYHTVKLLETDPTNYETYIGGLNTSLRPLHNRIRQWMSDKIVY